MPTIIEDRGNALLIQTEDGREVLVPRETVSRLKPDLLPTEPGGDVGGPALASPVVGAPGPRFPDIPDASEEVALEQVRAHFPDQPSLEEARASGAESIARQEAELEAELEPDAVSGADEAIDQPLDPFPADEPQAAEQPLIPPGLSTGDPDARIGVAGELRNRGINRQIEGAETAARAGAQLGREEAGILEDQLEKQKRLEEREQAIRSAQERERAAKMDEIDKRIERVNATQIDADRVWADMSSGREVMAWIGVALSGLGSALKGQGHLNPALDAINQIIERDIKIQIANRRDARAGLDDQRGMYNLMLGEHESELGAIESSRAALQRRTANQLRQAAARAKTPQAQAQMEQTAGQLEVQAAEGVERAARADQARADRIRQARANRAAAAARQRRQLDFRREQAAADRAAKERQAAIEAEAARRKAEGEKLGRKVFSPDVKGKSHGFLPPGVSKGMKKDFDERKRGLYEATANLKHLMSLVEKHGSKYDGPGGKFLLSETGKQIERAHAQYVFAKVKAFSGAQATDAERQAHRDALPIETFLQGNTKGVWRDELEEMANRGRLLYNNVGPTLNSDAIYAELKQRGQPEDEGSGPRDLEIVARTDEDPKARLSAIEGLAIHLEANPSTMNRPGVREAIIAADRYIEARGTDKQKTKMRRLRTRLVRSVTHKEEQRVVDTAGSAPGVEPRSTNNLPSGFSPGFPTLEEPAARIRLERERERARRRLGID